jgi:hypothetical protein
MDAGLHKMTNDMKQQPLMICVTQPRRVAAIMLANRVQNERQTHRDLVCCTSYCHMFLIVKFRSATLYGLRNPHLHRP